MVFHFDEENIVDKETIEFRDKNKKHKGHCVDGRVSCHIVINKAEHSIINMRQEIAN